MEDIIKANIRKLIGVPKEPEALQQVLKARLTKREYKLLTAWAEGLEETEISSRLKLDSEQYSVLSEKLIKKLNQEKLKQELVD